MTNVVFLPGLNNDARVWDSVIAALPPQLKGWALDLPAEPDLGELADRVADLVEPGSILVGHSFGGVLAMAVAERHTHRLAGLVLVNAPYDADSDEAAERRRDRADDALAGAFEDQAMGRIDLVFFGSRADDPEVRAERLRGVRAYGPERYHAHAHALSRRPDRQRFLETLALPVLVVAAAHDLVVPTTGQRHWATTNGAAYAEIPDTAHMLPAEEPAALADTIAGWYAGLDKEDMSMSSQQADQLPEGPLPDYVVHGDGPVTLFLLHGAYGGRQYFDDAIARWTGAGLRVVAWTCPGYGAEPVPEGFGIPLAAQYAARMVLAEQTEVNVLLGHSMGGLIGPRVPALVGPALHGLILSAAGSGFPNRTEEDKERYLAERVSPIVDGGLSVGEYATSLLRTMMAPGASGPLVDRVVEVVGAMKTESFMASMKAITEYDSVPSLTSLSIPTLMLAGEHDPACTPAGMWRMHEIAAGSAFHEVKGAGHYAFAEKPEEYHQVTTSFIERVRAASAATEEVVS